jgi:hypothetical protein
VSVASVSEAFGAGARAAARSAWLAAPGTLVALLRGALAWAAPLTALALARAGAEARVAAGEGVRGAIAGAALALTAPRAVAILKGLAGAALLLGFTLRAAWIAGALPVLGGELAAAPAARRFAPGLAFGFARVLGTALLALLLEVAVQALALAWVVGTLVISARRFGGGAPFVPAALVAGSCLAAVLALTVVPVIADAALARAALAGDPPARALWRAALRAARRPAAFLALALALGLGALIVAGSLQLASSAVLGFTRGAPALVLAGPQLMASAAAAAVGALLELWRLASVAVLACGEER